jgi:hypothetical protein
MRSPRNLTVVQPRIVSEPANPKMAALREQSDGAELRRRAANEASAALAESGWAIVARETLGLPGDVVEAAHDALWEAADRLANVRIGSAPARPFRSVVREFDDPEWSSHAPAVFGGVGGFTQQQFLPAQVALQTAPEVEAFYRDLFVADGRLLAGPASHTFQRPDGAGPVLIERDPRAPGPGADPLVLFYTYAERANITLPGALQAIVGQTGAKPHLDCNPWEADYSRGDVAVDPVAEEKANYLTRRWPIDRPYQSFVSLTECPGGAFSGGMGVSTAPRGLFARLRESPAHGRNPRWGNLVRIFPNPGGAWRSEAGADDARAVDEMHAEILGAMHYPAYGAGDLVLWSRETTHAGCERSFAVAHQARVYVNKLPLNLRNDTFAEYQGRKTLAGVQTHGRRADRGEAADVEALSPYQRAVLGLPVQ